MQRQQSRPVHAGPVAANNAHSTVPRCAGALQAADQHLRVLLAWDEDASAIGTLRAMRKMVPLYLHGFRSAVPLRQALLAADSLAAWDAAIAAGWQPRVVLSWAAAPPAIVANLCAWRAPQVW